jgi:hypothetical protein
VSEIRDGRRFCPYCGFQPEPVTLVRVDGTTITGSGGLDHAVDCPHYAGPCMSVQVPGPGVFDLYDSG